MSLEHLPVISQELEIKTTIRLDVVPKKAQN